MRTYGRNNKKEDITRCIHTVYSAWEDYQCSRKRGHGKSGLYCKQHEPEEINKRNKARHDQYRLESEARREKYKRRELLRLLAINIPTDELHKYTLTLSGETIDTRR